MRLIDGDELLTAFPVDDEPTLTKSCVRMTIKNMPTIEPEQKEGRWIHKYWHGDYIRECSACHVTQTVTVYKGKVKYNFCPYCGSRNIACKKDENKV